MGFPTHEDLKGVVPSGRLPYIDAACALDELGSAAQSHLSSLAREKRAVVSAIRGFVDAVEPLTPPLPPELLGLMGRMVAEFDAPTSASGLPKNEALFDESSKTLSVATFALRAAVDHGQRVTYVHPSVAALYGVE